jgi:hypothetical protein
MPEITPSPRHFDRGSSALSPRAHRALATVGLCAVLAINVAAGIRGVGFGHMWDESEQFSTLHLSVDAVKYTPYSYYYGGMYQMPGFLALAPIVLPHLPAILWELNAWASQPFDASKFPAIQAAQASARAAIDTPAFRSRDRAIFACLVSLTIIWVFIASRRVTGSAWAALAAAAATGLSWELSYHGRWIGADSIHAMCATLALALVIVTIDARTPARQRVWRRLAAVAVGMAMSCKVLAVFLLLPLALAIWVSSRERRFSHRLAMCVEACAIAAAAFLVLTPGPLLDTLHYANDVSHIHHAYTDMFSDDYPYTEPLLLPRLTKIASYVSLVLLSPYAPVALALLGLAIFGAIVGLRQRRAKVLVLLAYAALYLYFVAGHRVFIARTILCVLPVLAILMSVGVQQCAALLRRWRFGPAALGVALSILFALNARWIWKAATTVDTVDDASIGRDVIDYLAARPMTKFYIQPKVMALLRGYHGPDVAKRHIQSAPWADAEYVVVDGGRWSGTKANVRNAGTYFASLHANFDYYPSLLTYSDLAAYGTPVVVARKDEAVVRGLTAD